MYAVHCLGSQCPRVHRLFVIFQIVLKHTAIRGVAIVGYDSDVYTLDFCLFSLIINSWHAQIREILLINEINKNVVAIPGVLG